MASKVCHRGGFGVKWENNFGRAPRPTLKQENPSAMTRHPASNTLPCALAALGALFLLAALGCSGSKDDATHNASATGSSTPVPGVLRISQGSDLISLDPYYKLESPSFSIQRNIFEPLTDTDAANKMVPVLAESWRLVDPTHWEFKLRRGVKFHEGQPFTAADAVFSLRRALEWPLSRVKSEIPTIKTVEAADDTTLKIETDIPDAILPLRLQAILILNKAGCEAAIKEHGEEWLATHANGTGPYRVARWRKDEVCQLETVAGYWGAAPAVARLEFIPTSNDATRMAALHNGEVDLMVNVPPRYVPDAGRIKGLHIIKKPGLRLIYLGLDCGRDKSPGLPASPPNPLKDPRVRQAMAAAIDNRLIAAKVMGGNATPAAQLMAEGVTGYDPALTLAPPDLEKAKRLLAEAGYPQGFAVRLDGPNDRYVNDSAILQAVAAQLARVGIQVTVNATPKAVFFTSEETAGCSFFLMGWSNTNGDGAATFEHLLHTMVQGTNYGQSNKSTQYSNPELDRLAESAAKEFDPAKRAVLLQEANRLATRDRVHIPLHFQADIYAVSDRFTWTPRLDTQVRGQDIQLKK